MSGDNRNNAPNNPNIIHLTTFHSNPAVKFARSKTATNNFSSPPHSQLSKTERLKKIERALFIRSAVIALCYVLLWAPEGVRIVLMTAGLYSRSGWFAVIGETLVVANATINAILFVYFDNRARSALSSIIKTIC